MIFFAFALWIATINAVTYGAFSHDKSRAENGGYRMSEARLLRLAMLGGWPAAKLAQRRLRHKTRKMPFARDLNRVPVKQALILGCGLLVFGALNSADRVQMRSLFSFDVSAEKPILPRRFGPGN
ncbi:DUF1294 domain-containing protein [Oceaniglobus ichthyenteri]|uniref:DUF1294 domain-containing protein n=1 Tax=Oceaniglobus ichthyenteri TaxID=2136177 RepID=UPI000D3D9213